MHAMSPLWRDCNPPKTIGASQRCPLATSHSLTMRSQPDEASRLPSGEGQQHYAQSGIDESDPEFAIHAIPAVPLCSESHQVRARA